MITHRKTKYCSRWKRDNGERHDIIDEAMKRNTRHPIERKEGPPDNDKRKRPRRWNQNKQQLAPRDPATTDSGYREAVSAARNKADQGWHHVEWVKKILGRKRSTSTSQHPEMAESRLNHVPKRQGTPCGTEISLNTKPAVRMSQPATRMNDQDPKTNTEGCETSGTTAHEEMRLLIAKRKIQEINSLVAECTKVVHLQSMQTILQNLSELSESMKMTTTKYGMADINANVRLQEYMTAQLVAKGAGLGRITSISKPSPRKALDRSTIFEPELGWPVEMEQERWEMATKYYEILKRMHTLFPTVVRKLVKTRRRTNQQHIWYIPTGKLLQYTVTTTRTGEQIPLQVTGEEPGKVLASSTELLHRVEKHATVAKEYQSTFNGTFLTLQVTLDRNSFELRNADTEDHRSMPQKQRWNDRGLT